ncbi:MAG: hypothetical protein M1817_002117 [Caeruleum heppii]|nr:MAG: hypothetical protein M1817_002117 [Caeruleum heppii]
MASPAPEVPPKAKNHEYRVLVTGFGPFHDLYPINPSFLIASSLPHKIQFQASGQSRPSVPRWDGPFDVDPREINISFLRLPNAIPVSYAAVQDLVPAIYGVSEYDHLDFVIHIGMAGSRDFYTLEQRAHSYGYSKKDVEGRTILDGKVRFRRRTEGLEEWEGGNADLPDVLETDVAVEDVWAKWKKRIPVGVLASYAF